MNDLAKRYGKDVYIAETAYPWTNGHGNHFSEILKKLEPGYSATPEGQAAFVSKVIEVLHQVPNGRGKGILYWAPAWFS
ncbi:glycosyl hydrolase 53 family protein, partial [Acinetobacter baumannii]